MPNIDRPDGPWVNNVSAATAEDLNRIEGNTADAHQRLDDVETGNVIFPDLSSAWTNDPANFVTTPYPGLVSASPFSGDSLWHDLLRFHRRWGAPAVAYRNVGSETWTSWAGEGDTLVRRLVSGKQAQQFVVTDAGDTLPGSPWDGFRVTWATTEYSQGAWLVLGYTYSSPAPNVTVRVESSVDNVTWTTRHLSSYQQSAVPFWHRVSDWGGDTRVRLTIIQHDGAPVRLSGIQLLTARWGDQGGGSEESVPYQWDENGHIGIGRAANPDASLAVSGGMTVDYMFDVGNLSLLNTSEPGTPASGHGVLWVNAGELRFKGSDGNVRGLSGETVDVQAAPVPLEVLSDSRFYTGGGTSFSLFTADDTPTGAVLLLFQAEDWGAMADMPLPGGTVTGWTLVDSADLGLNQTHLKILTATTTSPGEQTIEVRQSTGGDPGEFYGTLYVFPPETVIEAVDAVTGTTSTSHTAPSLAGETWQRLLCAWMNNYEGGISSYGNVPGAMIERSRESQAGSSTGMLVTATDVVTSDGATGARTLTYGVSTPYVAASLLLSGPTRTMTLVEQALEQVPSLEDIEHPVALGDISATATRLLMVCNFDQRIGALSLAMLSTITANNTNYWTVELGRYRYNAYVAITSKTTQIPVAESANEGVTTGWPWTFDASTWDAGDRIVQKGDILALKFTPTGSPTAWTGAVATVRCEPGVAD